MVRAASTTDQSGRAVTARAGHQPLDGRRMRLGAFRGRQVGACQMSPRIRLTLLLAQQVRLRHHADRVLLVVDDRDRRDVVLH
jgi:hypothetical protein